MGAFGEEFERSKWSKYRTKTKPIQKSEFDSLLAWWNNRAESELSWKVPVEEIKNGGWNLDIKNPFVKEEEVTHTTSELLEMLDKSFLKSQELLKELKRELN